MEQRTDFTSGKRHSWKCLLLKYPFLVRPKGPVAGRAGWGHAQQVAPRRGPLAAISRYVSLLHFSEWLQWHKWHLKWGTSQGYTAFCKLLIKFSSSTLSCLHLYGGDRCLGLSQLLLPCPVNLGILSRGDGRSTSKAQSCPELTYSVILQKGSWRCTLSGKICYKYKTDAMGLRKRRKVTFSKPWAETRAEAGFPNLLVVVLFILLLLKSYLQHWQFIAFPKCLFSYG